MLPYRPQINSLTTSCPAVFSVHYRVWRQASGAFWLLLLAILCTGPHEAKAIGIVFDYTYDTSGFFSGHPAAKQALESAGNFYRGLLGDSLQAIQPSGTNTWSEQFSNPANGNVVTINNPSVAANTLVFYVGGRDLDGPLGLGGYGGFGAGGTSDWLTRVSNRGQTGAGLTPPTDFGNWGGSIAFDSGANWNFSITNLPTAGQNDFLSVALHEIGHALGLNLDSGDPVNPISFETYKVGSTFVGSHAMAVFGGAVPLESSSNLHWKEGTMSTVWGTSTPQEAAMDPTLTEGTRKYVTTLDVAALQDVGWIIIPEPGSAMLLLAAGSVLFTRRIRRSAACWRV